MTDRLLVAGAGGFGRELFLYASELQANGKEFEIAGFLDDNPSALRGFELPVEVVASIERYEPQPNERFVVGVGDPVTRQKIASTLAARGAEFISVVHPRAWVAPNAHLGVGCVLAPFTFVGPNATISDHAVLNCYASVGHDAYVGSCGVLSPYAVINGAARLEQQVFLGTHATVVVGKTVGAFSKVSAGAVTTRDVPAGSLVAGNPAKSRVLFQTRG